MSKSNINQHHPYVAKLRSWRAPIFNFSLLLSLGLVTYAFNWTSYPQPTKLIDVIEIPLETEIPITRTKHEKKRVPPPPVVKPSTEIIPEDLDFEPEPEPEVIDEKIEVTEKPREIVSAPVVKKVTPPPAPPVVEPVVEEMPFLVVEEMPRFNGCEDIIDNKRERTTCANNKLMKYIYSQIKYPPIARENGIEGTVVIQFTIEKNGSITDIKIPKDIGGGCGKEAARVVRGMPDWIPGKQRGTKVRVRYNLPVKYKLN